MRETAEIQHCMLMHPGSPELNDGSEGSLCVIMDVNIVLYLELNTSDTDR